MFLAVVPEGFDQGDNTGGEVVDAKKSKEESISLNDLYGLTVDALTLLGNSVYEFSVKRREMSLCHEPQPITTMLFGDDELPQSIGNISQVSS